MRLASSRARLAAGMAILLVCLPVPGLAQEKSIRVAAASDLQAVMPQIAKAFEEQTQVRVELVYRSSRKPIPLGPGFVPRRLWRFAASLPAGRKPLQREYSSLALSLAPADTPAISPFPRPVSLGCLLISCSFHAQKQVTLVKSSLRLT